MSHLALPDVTEELRTPAWLLVGIFRSEPGVLELREGRLSFYGPDSPAFDVPIAEVRHVEFPWYNFGAGMQFEIGGRKYRCGLLRPTSEGGNLSDVAAGREAGRLWKIALQDAGAFRSR